jgi:hypothetical protein
LFYRDVFESFHLSYRSLCGHSPGGFSASRASIRTESKYQNDYANARNRTKCGRRELPFWRQLIAASNECVMLRDRKQRKYFVANRTYVSDRECRVGIIGSVRRHRRNPYFSGSECISRFDREQAYPRIARRMNRILSGDVVAIFRHRDLQARMSNRGLPHLASAATAPGFGFRNPFASVES